MCASVCIEVVVKTSFSFKKKLLYTQLYANLAKKKGGKQILDCH